MLWCCGASLQSLKLQKIFHLWQGDMHPCPLWLRHWFQCCIHTRIKQTSSVFVCDTDAMSMSLQIRPSTSSPACSQPGQRHRGTYAPIMHSPCTCVAWWKEIVEKLEMWANAQRDGRPVEYRWSPLFNAAKFGWRPLLECRAVTLPRRETRWNLQGCPKLASRSQPLVPSSPYYQDMWRMYCCLTFNV